MIDHRTLNMAQQRNAVQLLIALKEQRTGQGVFFIAVIEHVLRPHVIEATIDLHGAKAHIFRHSYLTYAASLGIDLKTFQSIAGHVDIQTTMNRHVHKQIDKIIETGNRLQALFR